MAGDRKNFQIDLTHATQDVRPNSEPFTMPEFGQYEQSRAMDFFEEGGAGERHEINTIVAKYDWDAVSLTSASNWSKMTRFTNQDITYLAEVNFGAPNPWPLRDRSVGKLFTQELRLQSLGDGPFQWLAGLFYLKQTADFLAVRSGVLLPHLSVAGAGRSGLSPPMRRWRGSLKKSKKLRSHRPATRSLHNGLSASALAISKTT